MLIYSHKHDAAELVSRCRERQAIWK